MGTRWDVGGMAGSHLKPTNFTVTPIIDRLDSRCYKHLLCAGGMESFVAGTSVPTRPNQHSFILMSCGGSVVGTLAATVCAESPLKLPDLSSVSFLNNAIDGHKLLLIGIVFCFFGLGFGMAIYMRLKNLPVHRAMREVSELIYETCKTYLVTQGKFLMLLWAFIAVVIALYFGVLRHFEIQRVFIILVFSVVGIAGSYGVAWFGIRVNTFANSRTAFASLPGKPYPVYQIPLEAGMSIGMMLISVELLIMLFILLFVPGDYA